MRDLLLAVLIIAGLAFGSWTLGDYLVDLRNSSGNISQELAKLNAANAKKLEEIRASRKRVGPKIVLTDGPDIEARTLEFTYLGVDYQITPTIDKRIYYGAINANRTLVSRTDKSDHEMTEAYYRAYVDDPLQLPIIEALCNEFTAISQERGFTADQYADLLVKFVQSIPYDDNRAALATSGVAEDGDPRFPVQVLVDGTGDCDEKVFLLAALLKNKGYGVSALLFTEELHMSLGLASETGEGYKGTSYIYVETTSPSYISEPPKQLESGLELTSVPSVLLLGEGKGTYSQAALDDIELIVMARDTSIAAADKKKKEIDRFKGSEKEYKYLVRQYDLCYEAYNTLQETVNDKGASEDAFKDRTDAIEWVRKNCWWVWFG